MFSRLLALRFRPLARVLGEGYWGKVMQTHESRASAVKPVRASALAKACVAPVLTCAIVVLFWEKFASVDLRAVHAQLTQISGLQWTLAAGLSALSYAALGRYDAIVHHICRTGVPKAQASRAGCAALAVSQTLGLGIITGAFARWRLLPDLSLGRAFLVSSFMGVSFMAIWAWLTSASLAFMPDVTPAYAQLAQVFFVSTTALGGLIALTPRGPGRWIRHRLRAMNIGMRALLGMAVFGSIDLLAAAAVLYVLLDPAHMPAVGLFVTAFLVSVGLGLLAGTPGGIGAFELSLLSLMPHTEPAVLLAAVTGYRVIYYGLPATGAMLLLAAPSLLRLKWSAPAIAVYESDQIQTHDAESGPSFSAFPRAEAQLALQPGLGLLWSHSTAAGAVVGIAGHSFVMLRDPFPGDQAEQVTQEFLNIAKARGLSPCHYKCNARTAARARARGDHVMRIAREAWLDPATYDLATRARRQLRRKVRQADKDGMRIEVCDFARLPLSAMSRINADWVEMHGGERGFSMGRFHTETLARQRVYLAWNGRDLRGFISFHVCDHEWALDLVRPAKDSRDGAAHAMVHAAILDAARAGIGRVSLAAAPDAVFDADATVKRSPMDRLKLRFAGRAGGQGLARFKSMFDPNWEPLYLSAPSRVALLRAGAEITRAIAHPQPFNAHKHEPSSQKL